MHARTEIFITHEAVLVYAQGRQLPRNAFDSHGQGSRPASTAFFQNPQSQGQSGNQQCFRYQDLAASYELSDVVNDYPMSVSPSVCLSSYVSDVMCLCFLSVRFCGLRVCLLVSLPACFRQLNLPFCVSLCLSRLSLSLCPSLSVCLPACVSVSVCLPVCLCLSACLPV